MRKYLLFIFVVISYLNSNAQWTDKSNFFSDSNHMPVALGAGEQVNSMIIRSYPDSGFIVFWEDNRNSASTNTDIYAQKFNKSGKALWAANGIPVSTGINKQHLYTYSILDARNYSYAATDSTNGFYITYIDDSIANNATLPRIMVQHITSTGTRVFGNTGYVVASSVTVNYKYDAPQLIADGNKGFYVGYKFTNNTNNGASSDIYVYCFKDNSGKMQGYGGGQMDFNAYLSKIGNCNNYTLAYRDAYASDFMIYPDLQNGCNVVMSLNEGGMGGSETSYTGFNRLVRVKKTTNTKLYAAGNLSNTDYTYKKDTVVTFYRLMYTTYQFTCGDGGSGTGYVMQSNGFLKVGNYGYSISNAEGATLSTSGNINAEIITSNIRRYLNNSVTGFYTQRFVTRSEKFDNMPYEFKNYPYTPETYYDNPKPGLNTISGNTDTLLSNDAGTTYNYCMKAGGNKIYATALCSKNYSYSRYDVLLQQLQLNQTSATSYSVDYTTAPKSGVVAGVDTSGIKYFDPQLAVDNNGNAVFYMRDYATFIRVSPIINNTQLAWGAMGRAAGSGAYANSMYYADAPYMIMDASNGTSVMSWQDYRTYNGVQSGNNIFMRHFDKLLTTDYYPPYKPVLTANTNGSTTIRIDLTGSSNRYTLIELFDNFHPSSPAAEILDNNNLGVTRFVLYQNLNNTIRNYNGAAYLNRNFNIHTDAYITASTKVTARFFFTTADFNALKAADASVKSPNDLMIVQQPGTSEYAPQTYAPTGQERNFTVKSWKAVNNGYYIQAVITKFTNINNYYIFPASASTSVRASNPFAAAATINSRDFIKQLYPTPLTSNILFIETGNAKVTSMLVEVITENGKTLLKQKLPYQSQSIDLKGAANGMYHIRITSGSLMYNGNIIKQ